VLIDHNAEAIREKELWESCFYKGEKENGEGFRWETCFGSRILQLSKTSFVWK